MVGQGLAVGDRKEDGDILDCVDIRMLECMYECLEGIKIDKSPGLAEMYTRLLWEAREENAGALTEIFIYSLPDD